MLFIIRRTKIGISLKMKKFFQYIDHLRPATFIVFEHSNLSLVEYYLDVLTETSISKKVFFNQK